MPSRVMSLLTVGAPGGLHAGGVPTYTLNLSDVTFTPRMAKRLPSSGLFAAAPIVQGAWDGTGTADALTAGRGTQIAGTFYQNFDFAQGSIVVWVTPEWDGDDGVSHCLFSVGADTVVLEKNDSNNLVFWFYDGVGIRSVTVDASGWTAGTTYCIIVRWDSKNTLDGTNHLSLSIDDSHAFSAPTVSGTSAPGDTLLYVGSRTSYLYGASAIVEGVTVYRRVLYDGTYGTDVGNGDELALIYNAGSGQDPCLVTGGWDVVFCLPTDGATGLLSTGSGEAWSHPHSSAVLADTFCQTTYGSSAWEDSGTPSAGPSDITAAQRVFQWGYEFTGDAADEGISQTLTGLSSGQNYVLRVLAHTDTADDIRILVYDETNSANIVQYDFGASSDVDAPGVAIITFEIPTIARNGAAADCSSISVRVLTTAASQTVYVHQVELQENLVDNPSMETGSGNPWIPDGFTNSGLDTGTPDDIEQELSIVHSGASSIQFNTGASGGEELRQFPTFAVGDFVVYGGWVYCDGAGGVGIQPYAGSHGVHQIGDGSWLDTSIGNFSQHWVHHFGVYRLLEISPFFTVDPSGTATGARYVDDLYALVMDAVSLTVTPASEANSTEAAGLRVDGLDLCTQNVAGMLGALSGKIAFNVTPRHDGPDARSFGWPGFPRFFELFGPVSNFIKLYYNGADQVVLEYSDGVAHSDTWTPTGIVAGTTYLFEIEWSSGQMELKVDGVAKITIVASVDFTGDIPQNFTWGYRGAGGNDRHGDLVFGAP